MGATNESNIKSWSDYSLEEIEKFGDDGDFARQHLLTPTILSLLGDVKGKKILDAGCGTGYLSRKLAKLGAVVTGIEPSEIVKYDIERETKDKLGITYFQKDLSSTEDMVNDFDIVVSNMVLMDIPDYKSAIHNCVQSLKHGGIFVFSISHPCFEEGGDEWKRKGYVEVREYFREYETTQRFGVATHRPLSSYMNLVINEGCNISEVVEPQLKEADLGTDRKGDRDIHVPSFIFIKVIKN